MPPSNKPPTPPPTEEEIRQLQRERTDFFAAWRAGEGFTYSGERARAAEIARIEHPRRGRWRGFARIQRLQQQQDEAFQRGGGVMHRPARLGGMWIQRGPNDTEGEAMRAMERRLKRRMETAGFRFVKVLGWGGLGVAGLFESIDTRRRRRKVVCKMDIFREHEVVGREIEMHLRTAGAKHVIQRLLLQAPGDDNKLDSGPAMEQTPPEEIKDSTEEAKRLRMEKEQEEQRNMLDADRRCLFIEFMSRGRLDDYMGKMAVWKKSFPDEILWQVFDCMFRAIIGMAYPDGFQPVGSDPRTEVIPLVTEIAQGLVTIRGMQETMVHFDIDSLNVLVGDFDENEHNIVPIIKIADLGLAKILNANNRTWPKPMWAVRKCGKLHLLTPEQFSEEWDYVNSTPAAARTRTAGNYNWWTNLYQVGLVMFSMITLCETEYPPVIEERRLKYPNGYSSDEWTYGGYLLDEKFDHIDWRLRHLIARCLIDEPGRRPNMHEIEVLLEHRVRRDGPVTPHESEAQDMAQDIFKGPPPPFPKPREEVVMTGLKAWKDGRADVPAQAGPSQPAATGAPVTPPATPSPPRAPLASESSGGERRGRSGRPRSKEDEGWDKVYVKAKEASDVTMKDASMAYSRQDVEMKDASMVTGEDVEMMDVGTLSAAGAQVVGKAQDLVSKFATDVLNKITNVPAPDLVGKYAPGFVKDLWKR